MAGPVGSVPVAGLIRRVPVAGVDGPEFAAVLAAESEAAVGRLDPVAGVVLQLVWFDPGTGVAGRLLVVAHHVAIDGVSWRILLPDLAAVWAGIATGTEPPPAVVGTSMRRWASGLVQAARTRERVGELPLWQAMLAGPDPVLGTRRADPRIDAGTTVDTVVIQVPAGITETLLTTVPHRFHGSVEDGLLTALALAVTRWHHH
ncbi:condensation domain-containing protein, partial [Nocardia sienata]|uniref:condensation domain-containing protein n=1 Tax=Nocardia sienata TaxID=248552 RepID=UPI00247FAEFC